MNAHALVLNAHGPGMKMLAPGMNARGPNARGPYVIARSAATKQPRSSGRTRTGHAPHTRTPRDLTP